MISNNSQHCLGMFAHLQQIMQLIGELFVISAQATSYLVCFFGGRQLLMFPYSPEGPHTG